MPSNYPRLQKGPQNIRCAKASFPRLSRFFRKHKRGYSAFD